MELLPQERETLIGTLQARFEQNKNRHEGIVWTNVLDKLMANPAKIASLYEMEATGGEPDLVSYDKKKDTYTFFDFSPESPVKRRSVCYDREALESRKEHQPATSAMDLAAEMGIELLTEDEYRALQELGKFDLKTSSWIATPDAIRKLGGALFCDRRYNKVFTYHNGASSYYAARGFRGALRF